MYGIKRLVPTKMIVVLVTVLGLAVGAVAFNGSQANAAACNMVLGRCLGSGYFTNSTSGADPGKVLHILSGSKRALPIIENTDPNPVGEFIATLQNRNSILGSTQDRTGSAFIVYAMLGLNGDSLGGRTTTVSWADWADLTDRLDDLNSKGRIAWRTTLGHATNGLCVNAYYQGDGTADDSFHSECVSTDTKVVRFNDDNGNMMFVIEYPCANIAGNNNITPLPPAYNYALTPFVSPISPEVAEPDTAFTVTPYVTSTGPTKSRATTWQLTQVVLPPGTNPTLVAGKSPAGDDSCNYLRSIQTGGVEACAPATTGSGTVFDEHGNWPNGVNPALYSGNSGEYSTGHKICYVFSVKPNSSSDSQWFYSAPSCIVIGKSPKVQIWGSDIISGGSIQTSTSHNISGATFGSWSEYGVFASGTIIGMASGSAFSGGLSSASVCDYSTLSFTNAGNSTCTGDQIGGYVSSRSLPDVAASFPGGTAIGVNSVIANNLIAAPGTYIGIRDGDLALQPSDLAPGKSVILKVSGTVTIAGNQTYNPDNNGHKYTSGSQLPQLVVVASKIVINNNVTNVDAWLVASGVVETCNTGSLTYQLSSSPVDLRLTSNKCNNQLTVNGPVIANQLWLRRTAGSGPGVASGDPAEIFNLRPDTYLWLYARSLTGGHIQTVYNTELPPRL